MSAAAWATWLLVGGFALACLCMCVSVSLGERRCDRLNAANRLAWENWKALTDDDRKWLLENGASEPSSIHWEMR